MTLPPNDSELIQKIASALKTRADLRNPGLPANQFLYECDMAARALCFNFSKLTIDPLMAQALAFSALLTLGKHFENFANQTVDLWNAQREKGPPKQ